jgi:hypothetical protein
MTTIDYIITAKHYCRRDKVGSVQERVQKLQRDVQRRKGVMLHFDFKNPASRPVLARIELGQWIADCECGGAEFVDPDEPIFACMSCGNRADSGRMRPVLFPEPEKRAEIERLVLERPVDDLRGLDDLERAHMARAVIYVEQPDGKHLPLTRSWNPHESIADLQKENEPVERWKRERAKGKVK